jgi:predicted MPP superfamily phosphohydrolase
MKILALSDLHAGETRTSSTHPGIIRQASSGALDSLSQLIPIFNKMDLSLVVQMGDLIRDLNQVQDNLNFEKSLVVLSKINASPINLIGNHDVTNLSKADLSLLFAKYNFTEKFYGVKNIDNIQVIWLDFELNNNGAYLPTSQIAEIETKLLPTHKKIVFSHYSIPEKDMSGNFYFEKYPETASYTNHEEIISFLKRNDIHIALGGHEHWV